MRVESFVSQPAQIAVGGHGELGVSAGRLRLLVDHLGRLIAADDPNLVLNQLTFADRPLI